MAKKELKEQAIKLRIEQRLSLEVISKQLGVSQGSCSVWLRPYPLTKEEIDERNKRPKQYYGWHSCKKDWGLESKHNRMITDGNQKGRIAETAVSFRLALNGLEFYKAHDGAKYDFVVQGKDGLKTIQVKWARQTMKRGLPYATLKCADGRYKNRKYKKGEYDIAAIYNLYNDTVYVFTAAEIADKETIAIREEAAECWNKV